jgi:hypothetical protein
VPSSRSGRRSTRPGNAERRVTPWRAASTVPGETLNERTASSAAQPLGTPSTQRLAYYKGRDSATPARPTCCVPWATPVLAWCDRTPSTYNWGFTIEGRIDTG